MISIYINDQALELGSDFSIIFNFKSPVFNETGSYSYPIKVPFTPRNAGILNFKHRVENTGDPWQEFPCKILINGRSIIGLFKCTIGNNLTYEGSIYAIDGDFYYSIKDKMLQNYDFGEMIFEDDGSAIDWIQNCFNFYYPDRPCAFPKIEDATYYDPAPIDPSDYTFNSALYSVGSTPIVPFLYLKYVIKKLSDGLGYKLDNRFFDSHIDFNKLVLFNCVNTNSPNGDNTFQGYRYNHLYFNFHLPFISVKDFISGIETYWNLRFFINSTNKNINIISLDSIIKETDYTDFSKNILSKSVEPENQIKGFHLIMDKDDGDEVLSSMDDYESLFLDNFKGTVDKLTDLPKWPGVNPLEIRFVYETGLYYQMINSTWQVLLTQLHFYSKYYFGDGTKELETKFSSLIGDRFSLFQENAPVICHNSETAWNKISPRVFFTFKNIPLDTNEWGQYNTDNFSLWYHGDTGLFVKQFKSYLEWQISTKLIKTTKQMTWQEIYDIDFSKKYMMHGVKSLISSVQVTIKPNSISPSLILHYPCP